MSVNQRIYPANWLVWLLLPFLVMACGRSRHIRKANARVERMADRRSHGVYDTYTAQGYIEAFRDIAVREMQQHGIPASITLAQGLLESGNGNSDLARYANNHFGIKCTPDWDGAKYYKDDDRRNDCFRVYKNAEASFHDHSEFLKRRRYAALFDLKPTDYKGWAHGLREAGYATNPHYPQLLIGLIERYELDRLDNDPGRARKERKNRKTRHIQNNTSKGATYVVKKGDTLYSISQSHGLSVAQLMKLNKLRSTNIYIGQELLIR